MIRRTSPEIRFGDGDWQMAAQAAEQISGNAGAQREPSMEEILASIRRIIEDSDTARPDSSIPAAANSSAAPVRTEIDAFRHELQLPEQPAAAPTVSAAVDEIAPEPQPVASAPAVSLDDEQPHAEPKAAEPVAQRHYETIEPLTRAPAAQPVAPAKTTIISEVAGRQVAAAFDELTEAFAATRRRSFDEIAEEMIRPMLQDWLDNNLPTLVEKLVREEIERIARGGTRQA